MDSVMEFCPYTLQGRKRLNAIREEPSVSGALVRMEGGVACLQTWPELGEAPLDEVLRDFSGPRRMPVSQQAERCCRVDGEARRQGVSLWQGLPIPPSHFSLGRDPGAVPAAFQAVKIKIGRQREELVRLLNGLGEELRIRLDGNELLEEEGFRNLWEELAPFRDRIEFVEDPVAYQRERWIRLENELGCQLAVDQYAGEAPFLRVWKPARREEGDWSRVVVTSNMDHPIGQCFAAFEAGRLAKQGRLVGAGLITHHLFRDEDPFVERMGVARPEFPKPEGTGLGFDDLLEELPWCEL